MSWTDYPSKRNADLPADWQARRRRVLDRDSHTCRIRGERCAVIAVTVDHVLSAVDTAGPVNHDEGNLQAACKPCHDTKTQGEAAEGRRRSRARGRHPTEQHPGLTT